MIEHLLFDGVLGEDDGERPTLNIADEEAVRAIFRKERVIRMREAVKPARRSKDDRRAGREARVGARAALQGKDAALFDTLRRWRLETAQTQGVPPYVILHDATLAAIASAKPADLQALGRVAGIGEAKLARYGAAIMSVLQAP